MGAPALRLTGVTKAYEGPDGDALRVLDGVDLTVREGELFVLVGPSGCGKSTLLRLVAGLDEPTAGRIEGAAGTRCGIVFQDAHLLPWLDVRDNIALGLRYRTNRGRTSETEIDALLERFGLGGLADRRPDELSGGQAQRVAIARTIVTRPRVLLLDEPFSALDPASRHAMQDWLEQLRESFGLTVLFVTHDIEEALHLGDRLAVMDPVGGAIAATHDVPSEPNARAQLRREVLGAYRTDVLPGVARERAPLEAVR